MPKEKALMLQKNDPIEPTTILQVISRAASDPTIDVDKMERLLAMAERMQSKQSEQDFAAALVELQSETIRVKATKAVDQKADGTCRYRFAPYEEIMKACQPILSKYGFSITFDTQDGDGRLTSTCTLTHKGGHSRSNKFAVRYSKPPGSSDPQGDMSTKSYAKRGALCDALNITIDHDDDARLIGKPISKAEAEELEARAKACGADIEVFLKVAGAESFETIPNDRYEELEAQLARKEKKVKESSAPPPMQNVDKDGNIVW